MTTVSVNDLNSLSLFEGIEVSHLEKLAAMARRRLCQRGELLVAESSKGADVFALLSGRVEIRLSMPGGEDSEAIAVLKEGDILGESALLGHTRRIASAVAKDQVETLAWPAESLSSYIEAHPRVGYYLMRNLARILRERLTATNMMLRNSFNSIVDIT